MKNSSSKNHTKFWKNFIVFMTVFAMTVPPVAQDVLAADKSPSGSTAQSAAPAQEPAKQEEEESFASGTMKAEIDKTLKVEADVPESAQLPSGTSLSVKEVKDYEDQAAKLLDDGYEIDSARFFDISFSDDLEPADDVKVRMTLDRAVDVPEGEKVQIIHFDDEDEKNDYVLNDKDDKLETKTEDGELKEVSFESSEFSVYGIVVEKEAPKAGTLSASSGNYSVDLSYDKDAGIPNDATLSVSVIDADSDEYKAAKEAVLDEKKADDENFDENSFGMEALDISILDKDGNKIEPAQDSKVSVKIGMKELPDGMTENSNIEVKHIKDDEAVDVDNAEVDTDAKKVEFETDSFSTFTISWGSFVTITVHYVDENGEEITGTQTGTVSGSSGSSIAFSNYAKAIDGYSYQAARYGSYNGSEVTSVSFSSSGKGANATNTATFYNGSSQVGSVSVGKKSGSGSASVYLVYKAGESGTISDEEATATGGTDPKVTVKDTGNAKKLSGYHVVVEDADSEWSSEENFLAAYHIYLADESGKEVSASDLMNGQLNLQVTLTYSTLPSWFSNAKNVKHYNNATSKTSQFINNVKFDSDAKTISFQVHGFSSFVITSGASSQSGGGTAVTTQQGSILEGITFDDANEWQIVSKEYNNNTSTDKISSTDKNVRVQKNVIPTGTENEFYVYLSVDTKVTNEVIQTYLTDKVTNGNYQFGSSAHFPDNTTKGGKIYTGKTWKNIVQGTTKSAGSHYVTFRIIRESTNEEIGTVNLGCDNSNYQVYLGLGTDDSGNIVALGLGCAKQGTLIDGTDVKISEDVYKYIVQETTKTTKVTGLSVKDTLGSEFTYMGAVKGDYSSAPTIESNNTISWTINAKSNPQTEKVSDTEYWQLNTAELLYKVKYTPSISAGLDASSNTPENISDPTAADNKATGKVDVNQVATLTYNTNKTVEFPKPEVRGMLYELKAKKIDSKTKEALGGAVFELYTDANCTNPVRDSSGNTLTATSDNGGYVDFKGLQYGTYYMKEITPPKGHKITKEISGPYTVCYTTNKENLKGQGYGNNALYKTTAGTDVEIENEKSFKLTVKKVGRDSKALSGAAFSLYKADDYNTNPTTAQAVYTGTSDDNGTVINAQEIKSGTNYVLVETTAPTGYQRLGGTIAISWNNGVLAIDTSKVSAGSASVVDGTDGSSATITVTDEPDVPLTAVINGHDGHTVLLLLIALAAIAAGSFYMRKRHSEE